LADLYWRRHGSVSLIEAQQSYTRFGAVEPRFVGWVRPAEPHERIDPEWRPIDLTIDDFEQWDDTVGGIPGPREATSLYYCRPSFWRARRDDGE